MQDSQPDQIDEEHHGLQLATQPGLLLGQRVAAPQMPEAARDAHAALAWPYAADVLFEVGTDDLAVSDRRAHGRVEVGRDYGTRRGEPLLQLVQRGAKHTQRRGEAGDGPVGVRHGLHGRGGGGHARREGHARAGEGDDRDRVHRIRQLELIQSSVLCFDAVDAAIELTHS